MTQKTKIYIMIISKKVQKIAYAPKKYHQKMRITKNTQKLTRTRKKPGIIIYIII